jgi:hypothetical protein
MRGFAARDTTGGAGDCGGFGWKRRSGRAEVTGKVESAPPDGWLDLHGTAAVSLGVEGTVKFLLLRTFTVPQI